MEKRNARLSISLFFYTFVAMESKKDQVRTMFDSIAPNYDLLNHTLSLGIDRSWRKRLVRMVVGGGVHANVLDVATGTGDLAIGLVGAGVDRVTGADLSKEMVEVGIRKIAKRGLAHKIELQVEDVEELSYADNSFDAVTCAFGVRNFENLELGLRQMGRVLKPGAGIYILEFSKVEKGLWGWIYNFYFHNILPLIGRLVSRDKGAYTYLPQSVDGFASGKEFLSILAHVGFSDAKERKLMGGIATIYKATKK